MACARYSDNILLSYDIPIRTNLDVAAQDLSARTQSNAVRYDTCGCPGNASGASTNVSTNWGNTATGLSGNTSTLSNGSNQYRTTGGWNNTNWTGMGTGGTGWNNTNWSGTGTGSNYLNGNCTRQIRGTDEYITCVNGNMKTVTMRSMLNR